MPLVALLVESQAVALDVVLDAADGIPVRECIADDMRCASGHARKRHCAVPQRALEQPRCLGTTACLGTSTITDPEALGLQKQCARCQAI